MLVRDEEINFRQEAQSAATCKGSPARLLFVVMCIEGPPSLRPDCSSSWETDAIPWVFWDYIYVDGLRKMLCFLNTSRRGMVMVHQQQDLCMTRNIDKYRMFWKQHIHILQQYCASTDSSYFNGSHRQVSTAELLLAIDVGIAIPTSPELIVTASIHRGAVCYVKYIRGFICSTKRDEKWRFHVW